MRFTDYKAIKLATPPGTGVNPPAGNIYVWETVSGSALTINWRDSTGTDRTFSGGSGATAFTGLSDVPASYSGKGGYKVKVKADTSGLEFVADSGGGELPVTALGTSGTQTINRATSDKWTLTPASAVTLATSDFADGLVAELSVKNGGSNVTLPYSWYSPTGAITFVTRGVDKLRISYSTILNATKYVVEKIYSYIDYTVLLLHFNNNANDSSQSNHTPTATDITYTNTAGEFKYGYAAVFNAATSLISYPDSPEFDLGNGDFTLRFDIKFDSFSDYNYICYTGASTGSLGFLPYLNRLGNKMYFLYSTNGSAWISDCLWDWTPSAGVWYNVAFVKSGTSSANLDFYVNAVKIGATQNMGSNTIYYNGYGFKIGVVPAATGFAGKMDEFILEKGVARTITAATGEY